MLRKLGLFILVAFLLANVYGCFLLLAGAAGGAGTAGWLSGKLVEEVDVSFDRAIKAANSGLKSLRLEITKKTQKNDIAQIMGKYTDGKTIWVDVHRISRKRSRIEVRVGAIPDKEASRKIMDRIERYL